MGFILGLVLFGIATIRARVFPRWAGVLLGIGAVLALFGGETGVFLILGVVSIIAIDLGAAWMGWALWSSKGDMTA